MVELWPLASEATSSWPEYTIFTAAGCLTMFHIFSLQRMLLLTSSNTIWIGVDGRRERGLDGGWEGREGGMAGIIYVKAIMDLVHNKEPER